jgi:hypothetical protein
MVGKLVGVGLSSSLGDENGTPLGCVLPAYHWLMFQGRTGAGIEGLVGTGMKGATMFTIGGITMLIRRFRIQISGRTPNNVGSEPAFNADAQLMQPNCCL